MAMGIDAPDEHAVLLHEPEPRRRLPRPRDDALVAVAPRLILDLLRSRDPSPVRSDWSLA